MPMICEDQMPSDKADADRTARAPGAGAYDPTRRARSNAQ
jgi:hypothetical protein